MGYDAKGNCQLLAESLLLSYFPQKPAVCYTSVMRANPSPTITSSTSVLG